MEEEIENQLEPLENSGNFICRVSDLWEVITKTNPQASFFFSEEPGMQSMQNICLHSCLLHTIK